jgi:hypothetical protein
MALKIVSAISLSTTLVAPTPLDPKMGLTTTSPPSSEKPLSASLTDSVATVRGTGILWSSRSRTCPRSARLLLGG